MNKYHPHEDHPCNYKKYPSCHFSKLKQPLHLLYINSQTLSNEHTKLQSYYKQHNLQVTKEFEAMKKQQNFRNYMEWDSRVGNSCFNFQDLQDEDAHIVPKLQPYNNNWT